MLSIRYYVYTETLKRPSLWIDAASQNAFDTGAGTGIFVAYAAYMAKNTPVVKYSFFIPILNNLVRHVLHPVL
jgi:SNF family Na+-dependent transporter